MKGEPYCLPGPIPRNMWVILRSLCTMSWERHAPDVGIRARLAWAASSPPHHTPRWFVRVVYFLAALRSSGSLDHPGSPTRNASPSPLSRSRPPSTSQWPPANFAGHVSTETCPPCIASTQGGMHALTIFTYKVPSMSPG